MNIKCPKCQEYEAYIYLADYRRMIRCVACGYDDYLRGNQFNKKHTEADLSTTKFGKDVNSCGIINA